MARRTKEEAKETRNRILDTAERVFSEKGVSRSSLADIAADAGVTRGAIYWHFRNKADLFDAMMARVTLPMEEEAERVLKDDRECPLDFVRGCALNVLTRLATDPQCERVFEICFNKCEYVDEMVAVRDRHVEARSAWLGRLEYGLRKAADRGLLASGVNPRIAAVGLQALVSGLIANWVLDPRYINLGKAATPLVENYLAGLLADPRGKSVRKQTKKKT